MAFIAACMVSFVKIALFHLDDLDLFTHHYRPGLGSLLRNLPQAPKAMLFIPLTLDLLLILHSHVIVITVSRTRLFHLVSPTPEMHTLFTFASQLLT